MGFFSEVFDFAKQALPAIGGYLLGGTGGAVLGGALGGAVFGDEPLKDALIGGGIGLLGGTALNAAGGFSGLTGALGDAVSGGLGSLGGLFGGEGGLTGALGTLTGGNGLLSLLNLGGNLYGGLAGRSAASDASGRLQEGAQNAINTQTAASNVAAQSAQPYISAGGDATTNLANLVNNPSAQLAYIQNNPFYSALADDAQQRLLANAAASGKLGSGGTAEALQNQLLLLGNNLVQQQVGNLSGISNLGYQATSDLNRLQSGYANNISGYQYQQGYDNASGVVSGQNAINDAISQGIVTQGQILGLEGFKGVSL